MFSYDEAFEIRKLKRKLKKLQEKVIANQVLIDLKFGKIDYGNSKNDSSLQNNISKTNNFFDEELFEKEEENLSVLDNENLFEKQPINVEPNFDGDPIFDVEPIFEEESIFEKELVFDQEPLFDEESAFKEYSVIDEGPLFVPEAAFIADHDAEPIKSKTFEKHQFEEDPVNLQPLSGFMEVSSPFIKEVSFLRKEKLQEDVFNDTIKLIVPKLIFIKVEGPPPWKKKKTKLEDEFPPTRGE